MRTGPSRPLELYHLETDPGEARNIAQEHPDVVANAERLMSAARTDSPLWPTDYDKKRAK